MPQKTSTPSPRVSIIIPVYNSETYLKQCIESVLAQTFTDFECILVDDCSADNSSQICDGYAKQDQRIKVIHNGKNIGSSLARKIGLENSSGSYIQFVDSDDRIEADMIERMYKKAISEDFDIVYCHYIYFDEDKIYSCPYYDTREKNKQEIVHDIIQDKFAGMLWFKFFKRDLFNNVIFPIQQFQEDRVISVQLFLNASKIGYEYSILYHQRFNRLSLLNNPKRKSINRDEICKNMKLLNEILVKRSDYGLYKTVISIETVNSPKNWNNFPPKTKNFFSFGKKIIKALLPYGLLKLYWHYKSLKNETDK